MGRQKRPRDEMPEETRVREILELVSNNATRSERTSFDRKLRNMELLIKKLQPLEEEIIELMAKKMPIIDEVDTLRKDMVLTCVHPTEYLIYKGTFIDCKLCNRSISIPKVIRK